MNGNLIFEGDYINGKRWNGKGKEYNHYNHHYFLELIFEGEYLNGKRIRKEKYYLNDKSKLKRKIFRC